MALVSIYPYGKITIIQGDPGEGKTTLALRWRRFSQREKQLPYDDTEREPVKIIYQTAEDGWKIPSSRDWNPLRRTVRKSK